MLADRGPVDTELPLDRQLVHRGPVVVGDDEVVKVGCRQPSGSP